jgi:hypothetical protein
LPREVLGGHQATQNDVRFAADGSLVVGAARRVLGNPNLASMHAIPLRPMLSASSAVAYFDCIAFAGFRRAARAAGIVVARNVNAMISKVAIVKIKGSDARIAYTRLEITWPEK